MRSRDICTSPWEKEQKLPQASDSFHSSFQKKEIVLWIKFDCSVSLLEGKKYPLGRIHWSSVCFHKGCVICIRGSTKDLGWHNGGCFPFGVSLPAQQLAFEREGALFVKKKKEVFGS